jgi:hypothetical protein
MVSQSWPINGFRSGIVLGDFQHDHRDLFVDRGHVIDPVQNFSGWSKTALAWRVVRTSFLDGLGAFIVMFDVQTGSSSRFPRGRNDQADFP